MQEVRSDVVVIGGGAAAMRAAIAAHDAGARTVIVSKQTPGYSGNTVIARSGHSAPFHPQDAPAIFAEDVLRGGEWLNHRPMVEAMCREACARLEELVAWGVPFLTRNGRLETQPSAGHRLPRGCYTVRNVATEVARPVRAQVDRRGIAVLDHLMMQELLVDRGRCGGAVGFHRTTGEPYVVLAGAVILATGGGAEVYAQTTNVSGVTGDGLAMALRAGVALVDMEFVQYYPVALRWPVTRLLASPTLFPLGAKLYNKHGERFMAALPQGTENVTRDIRARAIFREIAAGRGIGDAVVLSLADIPEADFRRYAPDMAHIAELKKLDYRTARFLVRPEAHFFCGGIRTDAWGATALPGLYAVGEVAGGCHGANRLANNAFTECYVFGKRAGEHAAGTAKGVPAVSRALVREQVQAVQRRFQPATALDPREVRRRLRQAMWEHVGIIRQGATLQQALAEIRACGEAAQACGGTRPAEVARCLELSNLCLVAEAIALAALTRQESRGTHYREDFPAKDDTAWRCNLLVCRAADGTLQVQRTPVVEAE
ncbi:MAG: fumarate reductase subunit A [Candidatus Tectimicrobiota bacterium]|nr:MAG: fumarate reductase subunit A [Candidatus Tectomicrobia bacterium]